MQFDIDRVRAGYPALREGYAHFDGAAGTLVAARSSDAIAEVTRGAVSNQTNAFAACPEVAAIADIAHSARALVYVDGVHRTPHEPVDVAALGADFYVTSAYKWSGPHIAACVADPLLWERFQPDKLIPSPNEVP